MRDELSDDAITIDNLAEGGTASTVANMIAGVDGGGPPFAQRMLTSKAQIVLDGHGVEDDLGQSLAPYADALVAFIQDVRAAGKTPVLEEPGPVCDDQHPNLANYVSVMDGIAQQYGVPIVMQYNALLSIPNLCSHYTQGIYPDDYVLAQRSQFEATTLLPVIKPLVSQK
ncbi:GDSL-type esterase/lipase family protein [Paraburkholderia sp. 2C]